MKPKFSPSINVLRDEGEDFGYIPTENAKRIAQEILQSERTGTHAFQVIGSYGTGKSAFLLCAVANPYSVRESVAATGLKIIGSKILKDHERVTKEQLLKLDSVRRHAGADYLVVTEKDAVKLTELGNLPPGIIALRARLKMASEADEKRAHAAIRSRLHVRTLRGYLR